MAAPGASGSPVLSHKGLIIGVVSATWDHSTRIERLSELDALCGPSIQS